MSTKNIERTICGVGYRISAPTIEASGNRKTYLIWKNIIHRCYSKDNESYKWYGGKGVTVSEEWKCFDNFREDIKSLKGYDEKLFYSNKIELDKDGLSGEVKVYSKETCQWISKEKNISMAKRSKYLPHLTATRLVALSPNDDVYCVINIPMFANKIGVNKTEIYGTLSGLGNKTCRGWCFKKVVDYDSVAEINREDFVQKRHGVIPLKYEVVKDGKVIEVLNDVDEAAKYMKCSVSNINQRTRGNKEYHKFGVVVKRKQKEKIN